MDTPQKMDTDYLCGRMLSGEITASEKDDLSEAVSMSFKDCRLDAFMREHWLRLCGQEVAGDNMQMQIIKNKIFSRIGQNSESQKKTVRLFPVRLENTLMRIAAILFIPLLLGAIYTCYRLNKQLVRNSEMVLMQQVVAAPGSRVHFFLPDQSEVWLNSGSSLEFPADIHRRNQRKVSLKGEGYFKVAHDKEHPFLVETEKFSVLALGTSFDVSDYANENKSSSTLEEGSISILSPGGHEMARLQPGQKAVLNKCTHTLKVLDVETMLTTSWKDGRLTFRNKSLPEVTHQLERWYNCHIDIDPLLLESNIRYTGTIQDETLNEVLRMIELSTHSVQVKIKKREATFSRIN